jgi:hypothetical protein
MEVAQQKLAVLRTKLDKYPALQEAEVSLNVKVVDETKHANECSASGLLAICAVMHDCDSGVMRVLVGLKTCMV